MFQTHPLSRVVLTAFRGVVLTAFRGVVLTVFGPHVVLGGTKMPVEWKTDADAALAEAKAANRPLLVDFSAAPA